MTARTHDLAAITGLGVVALVVMPSSVTLSTALIAVLANQLGGIAPDIDQPTAPFWRNLPIGGMFGKVIGKTLGGHRFLTHSILGMGLFGVLVRWLLIFLHPVMPRVDIGYVWSAFMIGMFTHLCMDSFTKEGVPWLLPLPWKFGFPPVRAFRVTTGKNMEFFFVIPAILLVDIIICVAFYDDILRLIRSHLV